MPQMIISLYESNYPIIQNEEPKWDDLPIGYFDCDWKRLRKIENNKEMNLVGNFTFTGKKETFRPNSGDHLLAVFTYKGDRYIYNSTISYDWTNLGRKQSWWARLGLTNQIRKW